MTMHHEIINALEVDTDIIHDDPQNLHVRVELEDGAGIELTVRVDLRFVSLAEAYDAVQATFLRDQIMDRVGDEDGNIEDGIQDILVTRNISDNEISFAVVAGPDAEQFWVPSGERFRA